MPRIFLVFVTVVLMTMSSSVAFAGDKHVIYDSLEIAPNIPSVGAEAYAFAEFGDEITFAGSDRGLHRVTVALSSWGCQTGHWYSGDCQSAAGAKFDQTITLRIYQPAANNAPGAVIAAQTKTFRVPYRPSADPAHCTEGRWYAGARVVGQQCFNGLEALVTFDFEKQKISLPGTVVYGISYNTSHYGPAPIGESAACYTSSAGCPYDSLNIGLGSAVQAGSKPFPDTVYQNTTIAANYCDNGLAGVGTMRLDSPSSACWGGYVPAVRFTAHGGNDTDD